MTEQCGWEKPPCSAVNTTGPSGLPPSCSLGLTLRFHEPALPWSYTVSLGESHQVHLMPRQVHEAGRSPLTQGPVSLLRCQQDPSTLWVTSMPCPKIFCLVSEHLAFFLVLHLGFLLPIKDNCLYLCLTLNIANLFTSLSLYTKYKQTKENTHKKICTCAITSF